MALATIENFESRHGDVPADQQDIVEHLLEDASSLILDQVAGSSEPWALEEDDAVSPGSVVSVCVASAYRAWINPGGLERQTLGAASYTFKGDQPDVIFLTDREVLQVQNAAKKSRFRSVGLVTPFSGDSDESMSDIELPLS